MQRGQHKNVVFLVSSHDGDKNFGKFPKKMDFGPKNCIFGPKFCIFLRYTYETPIFSGQTHWTGLITCPPYPEVTLDTFGFPVDGRLAARRAISWPRLPKVALFGPKSGFFWLEINFLSTSSNFFVTIMTRHQKDNVFVSLMLLNELLGGLSLIHI